MGVVSYMMSDGFGLSGHLYFFPTALSFLILDFDLLMESRWGPFFPICSVLGALSVVVDGEL